MQMSQSTAIQAVNVDYYAGKSFPVSSPLLCGHEFAEIADESQYYPIIRVFGTLKDIGITGCVHIHGIFPYLYFRPLDVLDPIFDSEEQLAQMLPVIEQSLEVGVKSLLIEEKSNRSRRKIIHKLKIVQKLPLYGYHLHPQYFVQAFLMDPSYISKVATALESGVVLGKIMQPFESHIPYLLQFFQDFEIAGMDWIDLNWSLTPHLISIRNDSTGKYHSNSNDSTHPLLNGVRIEDLFTQPLNTSSLPPISSNSIEFDIHYSCIKIAQFTVETKSINSTSATATASPSSIPISYVNSLRALWLEEDQRRKSRGITTPLCSATPPYTQTNHRPLGDTENEFKIRLDNLFQKGEELHLTKTSPTADLNLTQWTRNCLERQNQYQEFLQEFTQRGEEFIHNYQINSSQLSVREESKTRIDLLEAPVLESGFGYNHDDDGDEEQDQDQDQDQEENVGVDVDDVSKTVELQSQLDVEDIMLTNTAVAKGEDLCVVRTHDSISHNQQLPSYQLNGFLHQVFEDSPVIGSDLRTLHTTSKQGRRRKRTQLLHGGKDQDNSNDNDNGNGDDINSQLLYQSPEKSVKVSHHSLLSPLDEFNSPSKFIGFDSDTSPPHHNQQQKHRSLAFISNYPITLSPTYSPPTLLSVTTSFREMNDGWLHQIPFYSNVKDVLNSPPLFNSGIDRILSSDKGRFGWHPQDIKHKSRVERDESNLFGGRDTLEHLLSLNSRPPIMSTERLLVPTFFPPPLTQITTLSNSNTSHSSSSPSYLNPKIPTNESETITMTPILEGSAGSQEDSERKRIIFKSPIRNPSPLKSQIPTPTQTQGRKKNFGMNIREQDQKISENNDDVLSTKEIKGRTTVLSLELFATSRLDLLPNPKFDSILCVCWVSLCTISTGDHEIEQKSTGIICNYSSLTISQNAMRSLVQSSCHLPSNVHITLVLTEKELFQHLIHAIRNDIDPDILVGYEIQKDSWGYLIERANILDIPLLQELSRVPNEKPSSRNELDKYGEEHESGIFITGRMTINLWRRMRLELKLFSYTIGSLSRHLLEKSFPDYTSQQLTTWYRDSSTFHRVVRHIYQRTELNHSFIDKLDLIKRISETSRLYGLDFYSVISRGSQFKVEAVMLRIAHKKGYVAIAPSKLNVANQAAMSVIPLVMEPQSNFYVDPVAVLDFQSLYPSLIISYNLCFSTILAQLRPGTSGNEDTTGVLGVLPFPEEYAVNNLYDTYQNSSKNSKFTPLISPSGGVFVGKDIREGVLPIMLKEILDTRVMIKQSMKLYKSEEDKVLSRVLDARQLALKKLANVTYGYAGAGYSGRMPMAELADAVVQYGRSTLEWSVSIIHSNNLWNGEVVYGDSVASYTPIYIKVNNHVHIMTIEELAIKYGDNDWRRCSEVGRQEKDYCELHLKNIETWSEKGWTRVYRVMRHKFVSQKQMIRVLTCSGLVDVTNDHSLLRTDGTQVSPSHIHVGEELLHFPLLFSDKEDGVNEEVNEMEARIMGFFFQHGNCGTIESSLTGQDQPCYWVLTCQSLSLLKKYQPLCQIIYSEYDWVIMNSRERTGEYQLYPSAPNKGDLLDIVHSYLSQLYHKNQKLIPMKILSAHLSIKQAFWNGMTDSDGEIRDNERITIDHNNQLGASRLYLFLKQLGYVPSISMTTTEEEEEEEEEEGKEIYHLTFTSTTTTHNDNNNNNNNNNPNVILAFNKINYTGYVYDLTTENHHFAAGIGDLIVHNTDSLFVSLRGRSRIEAHDIGDDIATVITSLSPLDVVLKMEKIYLPCVLASKKRYVGYSFESKSSIEPHFDAKGIEVARRDQCPCTVKIQEKSLRILFTTKDLTEVKKYLYDQWSRIHEGGNRIPIRDFIFRREVKLGHYAKDGITGEPKMLPPAAVVACQQIIHDPRQEPPYKWRVPYVVVAGAPTSLLKDLVVPPKEILSRDSKYRLNHLYYITKQINPALERVLHFSGINVSSWYAQMPKPSSKWTESVSYRKQLLMKHSLTMGLGQFSSIISDTSLKQPSRQQQPTIKEYLPTIMCILCGHEMDHKSFRRQSSQPQPTQPQPSQQQSGSSILNGISLCPSCLSTPSAAYNSLISRLNHLNYLENNYRLICRSCSGFTQIEELFPFLSLSTSSSSSSFSSSHTSSPMKNNSVTLVGKNCCGSLDCPVFYERIRNISKREDLFFHLFTISNQRDV